MAYFEEKIPALTVEGLNLYTEKQNSKKGGKN